MRPLLLLLGSALLVAGPAAAQYGNATPPNNGTSGTSVPNEEGVPVLPVVLILIVIAIIVVLVLVMAPPPRDPPI